MSNIKKLKVLFIAPALFGADGMSVNERELAKALSKKVGSLYVITFLGVNRLFKHVKDAKDLRKALNGKLIILPNFSPPLLNDLFALIHILVLYVNSIVSMLLSVTLKKFGLVDAIYIRDPRTAIAFCSPRKMTNTFSVKFAGFYTEEMARSVLTLALGRFTIRLLERINYLVVNNADLLIIQNDMYKPVLKKLYGIPDEKPLLTLSAGINMEEIPKSVDFESAPSKNRVGFVGSSAWWNGLDILIDSMCIVQKILPNTVLYAVIGGGNPTVFGEIRKKAKRLGLRTVFVGPVSHEKALKFMSELAVLVVPRRRTLSTELTIPIKVIEAFALGVPVIITEHKVFKEKYKNHKDVVYVEPDPQDVAEKIVLLLSNQTLAKKLSERGRYNSREFNYDVLAFRLAVALSELCAI